MWHKRLFARGALPWIAGGAVVAALSIVGWLSLRWLGGGRAYSSSIRIDTTDHDFGIVSLDTALLMHRFSIVNGGPEPVELEVTGSGCNCLSVKCPEVLAPGESGEVAVELEVRRREGRFRTEAVVRTSDPATPLLHFVLSFYGEPAIALDPTFILFEDVTRGDVLKRQFRVLQTIRDGEEAKIALPDIRCSSTALACDHLSRQILPGPRGDPELKHAEDQYLLTLDTRALGDVAEYSATVAVVHADASQSRGRELALPVRVEFLYHKGVSGPKSVVLNPGGTGQVRLAARDGRKFLITRVSSPLGGLRHLIEGNDSPNQCVTLTLSPGRADPEQFQQSLVEVCFDRWPDSPYRLTVVALPAVSR